MPIKMSRAIFVLLVAMIASLANRGCNCIDSHCVQVVEKMICENKMPQKLPLSLETEMLKVKFLEPFLSTRLVLTQQNLKFARSTSKLQEINFMWPVNVTLSSFTFSGLTTSLKILNILNFENLLIQRAAFSELNLTTLKIAFIHKSSHEVENEWEDGIFHDLIVQNLFLSDLKLRNFPTKWFRGLLPGLQSLHLDSNQLRTISQSDYHLVWATQIHSDFASTSIISTSKSALHKSVLDSSPIFELDLQDNPLKCDCSLDWLIHIYRLSDQNQNYFDNLTCVETDGLTSSSTHQSLTSNKKLKSVIAQCERAFKVNRLYLEIGNEQVAEASGLRVKMLCDTELLQNEKRTTLRRLSSSLTSQWQLAAPNGVFQDLTLPFNHRENDPSVRRQPIATSSTSSVSHQLQSSPINIIINQSHVSYSVQSATASSSFSASPGSPAKYSFVTSQFHRRAPIESRLRCFVTPQQPLDVSLHIPAKWVKRESLTSSDLLASSFPSSLASPEPNQVAEKQQQEQFFFRKQFNLLQLLGTILGTFIASLLLIFMLYKALFCAAAVATSPNTQTQHNDSPNTHTHTHTDTHAYPFSIEEQHAHLAYMPHVQSLARAHALATNWTVPPSHTLLSSMRMPCTPAPLPPISAAGVTAAAATSFSYWSPPPPPPPPISPDGIGMTNSEPCYDKIGPCQPSQPFQAPPLPPYPGTTRAAQPPAPLPPHPALRLPLNSAVGGVEGGAAASLQNGGMPNGGMSRSPPSLLEQPLLLCSNQHEEDQQEVGGGARACTFTWSPAKSTPFI